MRWIIAIGLAILVAVTGEAQVAVAGGETSSTITVEFTVDAGDLVDPAQRKACDFSVTVRNSRTDVVASFAGAPTCGDLAGSTVVPVQVTPGLANVDYFSLSVAGPPESGGFVYVAVFGGPCAGGQIGVQFGDATTCAVHAELVDLALGQRDATSVLSIQTEANNGQLVSSRSACDATVTLSLVGQPTLNTFPGAPANRCASSAKPLEGLNRIGLKPGTNPSTKIFRVQAQLAPPSADRLYVPTYGGACDATGQVTVGTRRETKCQVELNLVNTKISQASPTAVLTVGTVVERGQLSGDRTACHFRIKVSRSATPPVPIGSFPGAPDDVCVGATGPMEGINNIGIAAAGSHATYKVASDVVVTEPATGFVYMVTFQGDCDPGGNVVMEPGDHKYCDAVHTLIDPAASQVDRPTALLTVTNVVDRGQLVGTRSACSFSLEVHDYDPPHDLGRVLAFKGAPDDACQRGSETLTGTVNVGLKPKAPPPAQQYLLLEVGDLRDGAFAFLPLFSQQCDPPGQVVLLANQHKFCKVVNTLYDPARSQADPNTLLAVRLIVDNGTSGARETACDFGFRLEAPISHAAVSTNRGAPEGVCQQSGALPLEGITNIGVKTPSADPQDLKGLFRVVLAGTRPGYVIAFAGGCDPGGNVAVLTGKLAECVILATRNVPPTFDAIADQVVDEDSGAKTVAITGVSSGPATEPAQVVSFTASSSNTSLIRNPTVSGTGATRNLEFTPEANLSGSATITVKADDNGGASQTLTRTFQVTVRPVDDADLSVQTSASPDPAGRLRTVTYTTTVTNNGPETAHKPVLSVTTPAGTTFARLGDIPTGATPQPPAAGGTGSWQIILADLPLNGSARFSYSLNVLREAADPISQTTSIVNTPLQDPKPANNSVTVTTRVVDVGTFVLTPKDGSLKADAPGQMCLQWTIPGGSWRELKDIQVRVRPPGSTGASVLWFKFVEGNPSHQVSAFNETKGAFGPAYTPGSANVLTWPRAQLNLSTMTVVASGPTSPFVTLCFSPQINQLSNRTPFAVEVKATDDLGNAQDWQQAGTVAVTSTAR